MFENEWLLGIQGALVLTGGLAHTFPKALLGSKSPLTAEIKLGPVPLSLQRVAGVVAAMTGVWMLWSLF